VLIHPALDCHENQMVSAGVKLIRFDWQDGSGVGGLYHLEDVDELARAAEKDLTEAAHLLQSALRENSSPSPGEKMIGLTCCWLSWQRMLRRRLVLGRKEMA